MSLVELRATDDSPRDGGETFRDTRETAGRPVPGIPRQPATSLWSSRLLACIVAGDLVSILLSMVAASVVYLRPEDLPTLSIGTANLVAAAALILVWLTTLSGAKSRAKRVIGHGGTEYQRVINATLVAFGSVAIVCYVGQIDFARGYVAVALPLGIALLLLNRLVWRRILANLRRHDRCLDGAIVVGSQSDVDRAVRELSRNVRAGYRAVGVCITDDPVRETPVADHLADSAKVAYGDLVEAARVSRVRAIMVAGDLPGGRGAIRELGWALENSRSELILVSRLTDVAGPRVHLRPVAGLPMVHVQLPQYTGVNHAIKRVFDVVVAASALVLLTPVLGVIALLVRASDEGPALFRQERIGVRGVPFVMLKFRSMAVDAESRLGELSDGDDGNGVLFKLREDPRVTSVGRVLRRYSLDELPQLWNVVRGDMSLVGPRPPLPSEVEAYRSHETRRLISKPGITGLWQVSGRSDLTWEESIRLDLYYVENWSLTGDLVLLARTVAQVVKPDGAY